MVLYWTLAGRLPQGVVEFAYWQGTAPSPPFDAMFGFTVEQAARHVGWTLLLGPAVALLAWAAVHLDDPRVRLPEPTPRVVVIAAAFGLAACALLMFGVLRGRPIVDDEQAYSMQALLLRHGRLADPRLPDLTGEVFTIATRAGWTGKYLFGEPLFQVPGVIVGIPALLHLPLMALALACFFFAVRREAGPRVAGWAATLLATSPMLVFTSATGLSHTAALTAMCVAGLGAVLARQDRPGLGAVLVGAGLGVCVWVRPQTAASFGGVLALSTTWSLVRARHFGPLVAAAVVGSACVVPVLLYNHALSGSYTTLPWSLQGMSESWGFGQVFHHQGGGKAPADYVHTPLAALINVAVLTVRMNQWAFASPLSLAVIGGWSWAGRPRAAVATWGLPALALVAFYVGYYSPGISDTGPIYWFEVVLPLAVLGGHTIATLGERRPSLAGALLAIHVGVATVPFYVEQTARVSRLVDAIHGELEAKLAPVPRPTLIIYEILWEETRKVGWVLNAFPIRAHEGELVTFPNGPGADYIPTLQRLYPGYVCAYVRAPGAEHSWEVYPCAKATALMSRPFVDTPAIPLRSTAVELGLLESGWGPLPR